MKKNDFIKGLREILEAEDGEFNEKTNLAALEGYNSLNIIAIMAFIDENFNKQLIGSELRSINTVGSLIKLIGQDKFE